MGPRAGLRAWKGGLANFHKLVLLPLLRSYSQALVMFQPLNASNFEAALRRFDQENSCDPNIQLVDGQALPREVAYARWLTDWVLKLAPDASEPLRLAARCQHLCRWLVPRQSYPMTRAGYLQWREGLKKFHAQKAGEILREVGS